MFSSFRNFRPPAVPEIMFFERNLYLGILCGGFGNFCQLGEDKMGSGSKEGYIKSTPAAVGKREKWTKTCHF